MMQRITAAIASTAALALLSACGGGGGSSGSSTPPPPAETRLGLTADNQELVARTALAAISFSLEAAGRNGGTSDRVGAEAPTRRALAVSTENLPCPRGGRIVVTLDDANNNTLVDVGDTVTTDFQSCADADGVTTGRLVAQVREASSTIATSRLVLAMQVQNLLTVASNGDREGGSGDLTVTVADDGVGTSTLRVEATRMDLSGRLAGADYSHTVTQLRVESLFEARRFPQRTRLSATAQISSSAFGGLAVSLETPAEFIVLDPDEYPSSGQLLLRGAGGSQLRLAAVNAQQARLELDANGDSVFEASRTVPWTQLGF